MTLEEKQYYQTLAEKIMSGKDEWVIVFVDGHQVSTTTVFIKNYTDKLQEWVRDFLTKSTKMHEFGTNVLVVAEERWEKEYEGETIYQMRMKDPEGNPCVVIETYKRLLEKKVLKPCVNDGQNRGTMKW